MQKARSSREALFRAPARRVILLTGLAGSGKTQLLSQLSNLGEQAIDLEQLANHSGSVFGGLGRSPQPSHDTFERLVCDAWLAADPAALLWIEDESPFIGSVGLSSSLVQTLRTAPAVEVRAVRHDRITRLLQHYGAIPQSDLEAAVNKLSPRLGRPLSERAFAAIRANHLTDAIDILLDYYDAAYRHRIGRETRTVVTTFDPRRDDLMELVRVARLQYSPPKLQDEALP
ncbi:MAG: hypothetical protein LC794_11490 [Acidobacteria bacterium]|nr:hypothetical protein [Acidobacteriota bacterium]MCA1627290.1 hypothetical protein [Acidobacteriota bacterium]